ncbi:glycosyltransferase [bacterium]|nr:glycosyltransferase [bacterium]
MLLAIDQQAQAGQQVNLLCDGCTSPKLPSFLKLKLNILHNPTNQGLSFSRNKLLSSTDHEYILFLDADAVILPNFFTELDQSWVKGDVLAGQEFSSPQKGLSNHFRSIFWRQTHGPQDIQNCPFFMGICFAGKRQRFLDLQGFNESFGNFGEDVEFSLRYKKIAPIYYNSSLKVHHLRDDKLNSMLQMINNHNKSFIKAHLFHRIELPNFINFSFLWIFISFFSAIFSHKSPKLALSCLFYNCFSAINRTYYHIYSSCLDLTDSKKAKRP